MAGSGRNREISRRYTRYVSTKRKNVQIAKEGVDFSEGVWYSNKAVRQRRRGRELRKKN